MANYWWSLALILTLLSVVIPVEGDGTRYLLYSVNPGEGFNLRRDVYMRAATLVKELRKKEDWVLVLPPWPHLAHWRTNYHQNNLKWEKFFDLRSLNEYIPVIEFDDYLEKEGRLIDEVGSNFLEICMYVAQRCVQGLHLYLYTIHIHPQ